MDGVPGAWKMYIIDVLGINFQINGGREKGLIMSKDRCFQSIFLLKAIRAESY